jgi:hypothetical protein
MKFWAGFFLLVFCWRPLHAGDPYKHYLVAKVALLHSITGPVFSPMNHPLVYIPKYETPKGAIFCRMEDKVTRVTKVWLKLGVE